MIGFAKQLYHQIRSLPAQAHRNKFELALSNISSTGQDISLGTLLVDAMWDNPNFWIRYSMLHALNRKDSSPRYGLLGKHRRGEQRKSLRNFGVTSILDYLDNSQFSRELEPRAKELLRSATTSRDIFDWVLPHGVPGCMLYDYLLKEQRAARVELGNPETMRSVQEYLGFCYAAGHIVRSIKPDTIIMSHVTGLYAPLAWVGLGRGAEVIMPRGAAGIPHFTRLSTPEDIYGELRTISSYKPFTEKQQNALSQVGKANIQKRINGRTRDIGGTLSFGRKQGLRRIDRDALCRQYGWSSEKLIIGVYSHCWYDWPNCFKMKNFKDFYDWITATLGVAIDIDEYNWLLRPHPGEHWYGDLFLKDLIGAKVAQHRHINISQGDWHGRDVLETVDAVVTVHGTIGIEASSVGTPVLVADRGWYDHLGFVKCPEDRRHYLQLLKERWWRDMNMVECSKRANIIAGINWGRPAWQEKVVMDDDSNQWEIYRRFLATRKYEQAAIDAEVEFLGEWYQSGEPHYHTFKMQQAGHYLSL